MNPAFTGPLPAPGSGVHVFGSWVPAYAGMTLAAEAWRGCDGGLNLRRVGSFLLLTPK